MVNEEIACTLQRSLVWLITEAQMTKLTCLRNADGEVIGYFSDYGVEMAARKEWDKPYGVGPSLCHSKQVAIAPLELEDVEPGDSDRVDYMLDKVPKSIAAFDDESLRVGQNVWQWHRRSAISVEVQRFLINKYRRPGMSARDGDLGGPEQAAGVLYVLRIKAPKA